VPLIRDPTYYSAKQLDAYPEPLTQIRLQYPETAVAAQVNGRRARELARADKGGCRTAGHHLTGGQDPCR